MSIFPTGDFSSIRFADQQDFPGIEACRQRQVQNSQCDIETTAAGWANRHRNDENGMVIVDCADSAGAIVAWMYFVEQIQDGKRLLRIVEHAADTHEAFLRQLNFLATLKD